ncbi:hypothetical protein HFP66_01395 [Bacillus sp. A17A.1]|uniref:hypothetical protein n=1 Tax=Bacillus cereus TaxID=1396 RepID=UPI00190DF47F|nr:hypothetical protein [Bacillus cereus]MBK4744680.1 hypothetical protein [Bacillus cereus]
MQINTISHKGVPVKKGFYLGKDNWNDFCYYTLFNIYYFNGKRPRTKQGPIVRYAPKKLRDIINESECYPFLRSHFYISVAKGQQTHIVPL